MTLERLDFVPDFCVVPEEVEALFERARQRGAQFVTLGSEDRVPALVVTDPAPAWSILQAARDLPLRGRRFCEWGCGLGVVACLAAQQGWTASGFDSAPALVAAARSLALAEGIDVAFARGDYAAEVVAPGEADPFDADLIYVFAWPQEARWIPERFAAAAAPGTVLVLYEGGVTVRAYRKLEA